MEHTISKEVKEGLNDLLDYRSPEEWTQYLGDVVVMIDDQYSAQDVKDLMILQRFFLAITNHSN